MAKYDVKFMCGHIKTVDLSGKESDRQRKIAWLESSCNCSQCEEKKALEASQARKELLLRNGFAFSFSGTEKQIAYAEDIVGNALANIINSESANDEYRIIAAKMLVAGMAAYKGVDFRSAKSVIENKAKIENYVEGAIASLSRTEISEKTLENMKKMLNDAESLINTTPAAPTAAEPTVPALIKGKRWNGKVYGKSGNHSIYLDSVKTIITDEQAAELEAYTAAKEAAK